MALGQASSDGLNFKNQDLAGSNFNFNLKSIWPGIINLISELTMSLRARLYDITSTVKQHRKSKTSVDKLMKEVEGVREVVRRVNKV